VHFQVQKAGFRAEHGGRLRLGDQSEPIVILVTKKSCLDGGCPRCRLASIIPDGGHGQEVSNVPLFSVEYLAQRLLQLIAHCLAQFEKVVRCNIDLALSRWQWREIDWIYVGVAAQHQLQLEPLDFLHARLWVAGGCERFGDVGSPSHDLLMLVVVEDGRNL